jgi:hypothetical protein
MPSTRRTWPVTKWLARAGEKQARPRRGALPLPFCLLGSGAPTILSPWSALEEPLKPSTPCGWGAALVRWAWHVFCCFIVLSHGRLSSGRLVPSIRWLAFTRPRIEGAGAETASPNACAARRGAGLEVVLKQGGGHGRRSQGGLRTGVATLVERAGRWAG